MKEITVIKEDSRKRIALVYDETVNKSYIQRRIYGDKREVYKLLQTIDHPGIPHIISIEFGSDTVVTEEYIEGRSLSSIMREKSAFTKKQIYIIARQLASAMSELHRLNIIHRDIKPDNILMDNSGQIRLIDYDIARIYRNEIRKDTETAGTFGYAPIEQYGMLPTDLKTDIYAFGVTLIQLLEHSGIKGGLYKIAQKCTRLDPVQRYDTKALKRSLILYRLRPVLVSLLSVALILTTSFFSYKLLHRTDPENRPTDATAPEYVEIDGEMVEVNDELLSVINFSGFEVSERYKEYSDYGNFNSTFIYNCEDLLMTISFMEDQKNSGSILMGKNSKTSVSCEAELKDGVFSLSLNDGMGNSFARDFEYTPNHSFRPLYTKNRRVNAEMVCWDMDGDNKNELLIGICDCSFTVENKQIYMYFNYSQGWCLKYDEARGFVLCDGDMFSENSKFVLKKGDMRVLLPVWAIRADDRLGYKLIGDAIIPFY